MDLTKYVEQHNFIFDEVFDATCNNDEVRISPHESLQGSEDSHSISKVYRRTAQPLVEYIFGGGKATCFA